MSIRRSIVPLLLLLCGPTLSAQTTGYVEEIIGFTSHDGIAIECILSYPDAAAGPSPGMLLIPGSGLHDADVTLFEPTLDVTRGQQTLFRPLARSFSRHGWAVLRCNKRGASFGHRRDRPQLLETATLDDLVQDARDALTRLRGHSRVEAKPLVVLAHSEGTLIANRLAVGRTDIDLLVLVGSMARSYAALIEYQLVDRNLEFFERAVDTDHDGTLTLTELESLDGRFGMGSVYVRNSAEVLFASPPDEEATSVSPRLNPATDRNGDGQLQIRAEIETALREAARRLLELARDGSLGEHWRSLTRAGAPLSTIHLVQTPILFVHGALDVQTPLEEALALMAALEARGRSDYEILVFPRLGHSLSRPNDYITGDGGLTVLDNLTLNAPGAGTRRRLLEQIEAQLLR